MPPISVAVIGLGMSGRVIHCRYFATAPERWRLVAVADPSAERRASASAEYGCAAYPDYQGILANHAPDFVVNASPNHLHVPISLDLLRHGLNVISEKPVAESLEGFDTLVRAAEEAGRAFAVFQDLRFTPHFVQLRKVLDSGLLGRILQVSIYSNNYARKWDWRTLKSSGGGNLMNIAPHLIDQAVLLLGDGARPQVLCRLDPANSFGDADNYVKIVLSAPDRPLIDIEASSSAACPPFRYCVQGVSGGLLGWAHKMSWRYFKPEEAPRRELVRAPLADAQGNPTFCTEELRWYEESWEDERDEYEVAPRAFYESFHRSWTSRTPFEVGLQQVRRQMEIVEECRRQGTAAHGA